MKLNVVRFNFWINPAFDEMLQLQEKIALKVCNSADSDAINIEHFKSAHIYQINAARDEIPPQWHVDEALLTKLPNLLCVSTSGAGYDPVNIEACNRHGVLVVNQSGCNADSVCEHTFALILSLKHRINESDTVLRAGKTKQREDLMGNEIKGLTLGLVGLGNVGRRVALLAKAFGMNVLAYDPHIDTNQFATRHAQAASFDELLERSDIVSVHCPRTSETLNMFDANAYAKMKTGAMFISTARGGIHNETALYESLISKKLAGAGLDVWAKEPPAKDAPLLALTNVVATYHTAGVTHEARRNAATMAAEQLMLIADGQKAPRIVNPEVLQKFEQKRRLLSM
jgi:D-3-phosphoglycerate dehydrogenase / 2-oxoglutarate reductase